VVTMTIFTILALIKRKFGIALLIYWILFAISGLLILTIGFAETDTGRNIRLNVLYITMGYFFVYLAIVIKEKTKNKNVNPPPNFRA
jgi:hypothetical protein